MDVIIMGQKPVQHKGLHHALRSGTFCFLTSTFVNFAEHLRFRKGQKKAGVGSGPSLSIRHT